MAYKQTGFLFFVMKQIGLLFLMITFSGWIVAQSVPDAYRRQFSETLALNFSKADPYLNKNADGIELAYQYHLADYQHFLKAFINEQEDSYDFGMDKRDNYLDHWQSLYKGYPEKGYFVGDSYLRWAMLQLKMNQRFKAAFAINKAYRNLKKTVEQYPDYLPAKADLGILEIFIGSVPERYQWVMELLNFEGSVESGKAKIDEVLRQTSDNPEVAWLKLPVLFMRSFIDINLTGKPNDLAMRHLSEMHEDGTIANQPFMIFLYAGMLQKQQKNEQALQVLSLYDMDGQEIPFYYLYYMKGLSQLYALDRKCLTSFDTYLKNFDGKHYIKSAYQKKAWFHLLQGDTLSYKRNMQYVLDYGNDLTGADDQAMDEAEHAVIPPVALLKGRLLFDGGYYPEALEALNSGFEPESTEQLTEYYYRKGRIYHETDSLLEALNFYEKAYSTGENLEAYYAANAMLLSGRILNSQDRKMAAVDAFEKCLELSGFQYQYAIHQKARAGLAEAKSE